MLNIIRIAGNNIRRIIKKTSGILVYVLLPPALAVVFMILVSSGESARIPIGVADNDNSVSSSLVLEHLENNGEYTVIEFEEDEIREAVVQRKVRAGIIIPFGFEDYLKGDGSETVIGVVSLEGSSVTGWLKAFIDQKAATLYKAGVVIEDEKAYEKTISEYGDKYASVETGELTDESNKMNGTRAGFGMYAFASLFGIWSICALAFREKVNKTYQRIMSAPVSPWTYIAGNSLATLFFAFLHTAIAFLLVYNLFNIGDVIPAGEFSLLIAFFYIAAIPMGFLLMSLGKSESAVLSVNVVVLTLTSMLGGCYWPVEFMPGTMQIMSRGTIQYWFTDGIDKLMEQGGVSSISTNLAVLAAFGAVFATVYVIIESTKKNKAVI